MVLRASNPRRRVWRVVPPDPDGVDEGERGLLASTGATPPGRKATDSPQGVFDHVMIERKPSAPPAAPVALAATALGGRVVRLEWKNASGTSQSGVKIEASLDGAPFYEIADLAANASRFENTGIERPAALRYRIRAYNTGGYSAYSNVAPSAPAPQAK
ncbi:MAG: hypothetical protein ABIS50_06120 [Luteolibacter sp.]|uniref:hypothetical protein n=1 Tax=Luteolibacter sp. TaxID=1962973 RepID=UPI003267E287